jgi:hypothetical protein
MLKDILAKTFDKHIWARYLKELSFQPSIETLYASAIGNLNKHETEKTITYIILTLESDIGYEPAQHLSRIMLFGLSEEFIKKKGPSFKEKHSDLNKYLINLEQTYTKLERELVVLQNNISKMEQKLKEGFSLSSFLKKKDFTNQLSQMKDEAYNNSNEILRLKKEISKVTDVAKIEEYMKVIAFILEYVSYPKRFALSKI